RMLDPIDQINGRVMVDGTESREPAPKPVVCVTHLNDASPLSQNFRSIGIYPNGIVINHGYGFRDAYFHFCKPSDVYLDQHSRLLPISGIVLGKDVTPRHHVPASFDQEADSSIVKVMRKCIGNGY